jgi:glyoxylase-like metal-dependent hydrolase (beta-lactamase superfamily II)
MKIIPLSEGSFTVDITKKFIPFNNSLDNLQERATGSLLVEVQPFCIITANDIILIDTGLGFCNQDGTLQVHQNLMNEGINPLDITKVLLSHLHKDHSGGISREDRVLNQKFFSFPNAHYYVNKNELDFAMEKGKPSYTPEEFDILLHSDKVIFTSENGTIENYIHYQVTGAHSPFHQSFLIEEDHQKIFFGGDVAPQYQQMKSRFIAKYDYDGRKCMELRHQWFQQGSKEKWTFLFYHDIKIPVFSL